MQWRIHITPLGYLGNSTEDRTEQAIWLLSWLVKDVNLEGQVEGITLKETLVARSDCELRKPDLRG